MLVAHFLDLVPIWLMLIGTILIMVGFIEIGFRLGKHAQANARKAQTSQVRAIMGAGLGLLAFMLAFTFSTAQSHFEMRVQSLAEEARIARNAYMQADLLSEPRRTQTKELLKEYIKLRSDRPKLTDADIDNQVSVFIEKSEQILQRLWNLATHSDLYPTGERNNVEENDLFMGSVLALTDDNVGS